MADISLIVDYTQVKQANEAILAVGTTAQKSASVFEKAFKKVEASQRRALSDVKQQMAASKRLGAQKLKEANIAEKAAQALAKEEERLKNKFVAEQSKVNSALEKNYIVQQKANKSAKESASVFEVLFRNQEKFSLEQSKANAALEKSYLVQQKSNKSARESAKSFMEADKQATKAYTQARREATQEDQRRTVILKDNRDALNAQRVATEANTAQVHRYRMASDAVYAAEQKLLQLKKTLRTEVANDNMTMREAAAVQMQYKQNLNQVNAVTQQTRSRQSQLGVLFQQTGYQVGDFAVQVQSGQNAMVAFGQQATQLVGTFGMLSKSTKMIGLFAGLGIAIPVLTAIGAAFMRTSEKGKDSAKSIKDSFSVLPEFFKSLGITIANSFDVAFKEIESKYGEMFARLAQIKLDQQKSSISSSFKSVVTPTVEPSIFEKLGAALAPGMVGGNIGALENIEKQTEALYSQSLAIKTIEDSYLKSVGAAKSFDEILDLTKSTQESLSAVSKKASDAFILQAEELGLIKAETGRKDLANQELIDRARETSEAERILGEQMLSLERDKALAQFNLDLEATNRYIEAMFQNRTLYYSIRFSGDSTVMGQSLTPAGSMKPSQSYEELLGMGWTPEDLKRIGMDAPKGSSGGAGGGGGGKSQAEELSEYLQKKQEEAALQERLLGFFGEERDIQSELISAKEKYNGVMTTAQANELEATLRQIAADKERQAALEESKTQMQSVADTLQSSMSNAFMSMVEGTKSFKDAMKDMARAVIKQLFDVLVVQKLVGSFDNKTGIGSGIVGAIGKLGVFQADGGAWQGGSQIKAYANGGVVGGPTYFPMSGGKTGLMGEAGPEAIMPLKRGANGKLGVETSGSGSVVVNNNFNVSANGDDSVKRIIQQQIPRIAEATKAAVVDSKRRGGSYGRAFG